MNRIVSEVYSPPRVAAAAKLLPSLKLVPGFSWDVTTVDERGIPWDFDDPERRKEALDRLEREKPMLLIGSPMCTAFSAWQKLNEYRRDSEQMKKEWNRAMIHLRFVCDLYRIQMKGGRYFLHEHPVAASSWKESCIREILDTEEVQRVNGDQCQYGQESEHGGPIKKPTGWMSNSPEVLHMLRKRCSGRNGSCSRAKGGTHTLCSGGVARRAAIYPFRLCKAILQGFRNQLRRDGVMEVNVVGMQVSCDYDQILGVTEDQEIHSVADYRKLKRLVEKRRTL